MSSDTRKPVVRVSDQVQHKQGCTATEYGYRLEISYLGFGLMLNVLVNNFSVMLGRSHRFLGITSTFLGVSMSCSRTQHGDPSGAQTPDLWIQCPRC